MELIKLSLKDGQVVYEMLQEIGANENDFHNYVYGKNYEEYIKWLKREYEIDNGINMENWMVPQSSYWLFDKEKPIGVGRIRHYLNDNLRENSGHIGYAIRASERGKGYGNAILNLLLKECSRLKIEEVQISAFIANIPSNKIIKHNGGILFRSNDIRNFYKIDVKNR